jgi:hypothetical protein
MASVGCSNPRMLQGTELAAAIRAAMEQKKALPGNEKVGPTSLGQALGIAQSSASELLKTGRLSKEKLPKLLAYFEDVVGPDHFGLPFTKFEAEFVRHLRRLPVDAQHDLLASIKEAAERVTQATAGLRAGTRGKPHRTAA